jgi:hypothetical protein
MNKLIFAMLALCPLCVFADSEKWFLMSREGECAAIGTLEKKVPGAANVNSPTEFVELMNKKGFKTAPVNMPGFDGDIVQVDVAKKGLYLIFVKETQCKEAGKKNSEPMAQPAASDAENKKTDTKN